VKSSCTPQFWKRLEALPVEVRKVARKNYQLWTENHRHPSLRFKPIEGNIWSVRVGKHYRALGEIKDDHIRWFWIGTHAEYDQLTR